MQQLAQRLSVLATVADCLAPWGGLSSGRLVGLLAGLGLAHVRCRWCPRLANLAEGTHCQCILRLVGLSAEGGLISIATTPSHFVSPDQAQD